MLQNVLISPPFPEKEKKMPYRGKLSKTGTLNERLV